MSLCGSAALQRRVQGQENLLFIFTSTQRLYFTNRVSLHSVFIIHNIQTSYTFAQNWSYFKNRAASFVFVFFRRTKNRVKLGERCHTVFASDFKEFPKVPSNVLDLFVCATQKCCKENCHTSRKSALASLKRLNLDLRTVSGRGSVNSPLRAEQVARHAEVLQLHREAAVERPTPE